MNEDYKKIVNMVVLDIETTGFLTDGGKIVEIGMVLVNIKAGYMKKIFDEIINHPGIKEDPDHFKYSWIFCNSTLTIDNVIKNSYMDSHRKRIQSILDRFYVTAFNKEFDLNFLKDYGFKVPKEFPCIMRRLTPVMKLPRYDGYKFPNVEEAWRYYFPEVKYKELHRAFDDAFHESQIFLKMIENHIFDKELKKE